MNSLKNIYKKDIKKNIKSLYTGTYTNWYREYNSFLHKAAKKHKLGFFKTVGIFTVYSTNASIDVNLMLFERFLSDPLCENMSKDHIGMRSVYNKASLIYKSSGKHEDVLKCISTNPKTGKYLNTFKLRSFYLNLSFPNLAYKLNYRGIHKTNYDRLEAVTIDRHAICLAIKDESFDTRQLNKNNYVFIAKCYNELAKELKILPQELQASTWVAWRKKIGKEWYSHNEVRLQNQILSI